jgi:hypothetical protein
MDWIGLTQDMEGWRALVNVVMNLPVPINAGKFFWLAEDLLPCQEGIRSTDLLIVLRKFGKLSVVELASSLQIR